MSRLDIVEERVKEYSDTELDAIIIAIKNGTIKCGRYSHLVKLDKSVNIKGKEFFSDGSKSEQG